MLLAFLYFQFPRDEPQEGCRCYCGWRCCCYLRESSSSSATASITLSGPPRQSLLPVASSLSLSAAFGSPPPTCHPIVAHLLCHLFNLICPLRKQGLGLLATDFSRGRHRPGVPQSPVITQWPQEQFAGTSNAQIWKADCQVCVLPLDKAFNFSGSPFPYGERGSNQ